MQRSETAEIAVVTALDTDTDPSIILKNFYGDSVFRLHRITETLWRRNGRESYRVKAQGPRQTTKGNDHASQYGERTWETGGWGEPQTPPAEVAELCLGRDVLASRLMAAEEPAAT